MRITSMLPFLVICFSLLSGAVPSGVVGATEAAVVQTAVVKPIVLAGCPSTKIDCPQPQKPKPTSSDRKKGNKGKKS